MPTVELKSNGGRSEICIPGTIGDLESYCDPKSTILLVDANVRRLHGDKLEGFQVIDTGFGEENKTLQNASRIYGLMIEKELDRSWTIVGIGGGITTDLTGFVASTFLRGLRFGFISTTLLGQVDAAVGGKNGVNYEGLKNMIGIIRQPDFVLCDTEVLKTLPRREFIGGFAEIIKYAAIRRADLFPYLQEHILEAAGYGMDILTHLIFESVLTKIEIVESDENEKGDRKLLNFGHTFGHALEKLYHISHGEAVAVGMLIAARLSVNLGMLSDDKLTGLEDLIKTTGLPTSMQWDPDNLAVVMRSDKKRKGSEMQFILLEDIGKAVIRNLPLADLKPIMHDLY